MYAFTTHCVLIAEFAIRVDFCAATIIAQTCEMNACSYSACSAVLPMATTLNHAWLLFQLVAAHNALQKYQ